MTHFSETRGGLGSEDKEYSVHIIVEEPHCQGVLAERVVVPRLPMQPICVYRRQQEHSPAPQSGGLGSHQTI